VPEAERHEAGRVETALEHLAGDTSRRGFLARLGGALMAATAGATVARFVQPGDADAFHFCGHTFTTGSCVHPLGLPRVDSNGFPLSPSSGKRVDDIGRVVNRHGNPLDADGNVKKDPDGRPLPPTSRTKVCKATARIYGIHADYEGAWYRCCGGHVRKLWDCCSRHKKRINGDDALRGYCHKGHKVFCVTYYQTNVPC
jgi:hypothetical protein